MPQNKSNTQNIYSSIPNLINGVSQQADVLRYPTQCQESINSYPNPSSGLGKRPPFNFAYTLDIGTYNRNKFFFKEIIRDESEKYLVVANLNTIGGFLKVFNAVTGEEYIVTHKDGVSPSAYLSGDKKDIDMISIGDYSWFINRTKVCKLTSATATAKANEALIFIKQSKYNSTYTLKIYTDLSSSTPAFTASYSTETSPSNALESQGKILDGLMRDAVTTPTPIQGGGLETWLTAHGFTIKKDYDDGQIYISSSNAFRIDSQAPNDSMYSFQSEVQDYTLLPAKCLGGLKFKITGSPTSPDAGKYYLQYNLVNSSNPLNAVFGSGNWIESIGWGEAYQIDNATMPHQLVRLWDDNLGTVTGTAGKQYFQYQKATWTDRNVGDLAVITTPSFIGNTINAISFYQNRLVLCSGENILMSQTGEFYNFWRTTALQVLDDDPIDQNSAFERISILKHVITNAESLIVMSDSIQYKLYEGQGFTTPKSTALKKTSEYQLNNLCKPIAVGNRIILTYARGTYTGVLEYYTDPYTNLWKSKDITEHIPVYIDGTAKLVAKCETENALVLRTDDFNGLYLYKYYDNPTNAYDRIQSAWQKWEVKNRSIEHFFFDVETMYAVLVRPDNTAYVCSVPFQSGYTDYDLGYQVYLDNKYILDSINGTYDSHTDTTEFLVVNPVDTDNLICIDSITGKEVEIDHTTTDSVFLKGNRTDTNKYLIGNKYSLTHTLTKPQIRQSNGRTETPVLDGRLQLRYGQICYTSSIYFNIQVTHKFGSSFNYEMTTKDIGSYILTDEVAAENSVFRFPIVGKSDRVSIVISNETAYPCNLLAMDFEGSYSNKFTRV